MADIHLTQALPSNYLDVSALLSRSFDFFYSMSEAFTSLANDGADLQYL